MRRAFVAAAASVLTLAVVSSAGGAQGTRDDPDDVPGVPDVRRLYHLDRGDEVVFYMESYDDFASGQGPSCTWRLQLGGDRNPDLLVLHGLSAQRDPAQQITYRGGGQPDETVRLNSHRKVEPPFTSATSTARNTIRVPVPMEQLRKRGLPDGASRYTYTADCGFSGAPGPGSSTGTDYVPSDRAASIAHTLGGAAATAAPSPRATVRPPTPAPATAAPTAAPRLPTPAIAPTPSALAVAPARDDDGARNALIAAAVAAVILALAVGLVVARRRRAA